MRAHISFGLALFLVLPGAASAAVLDVPAPGPDLDVHEAIQEALIEAEPGDTVRLAAGTYPLKDGLSLDVDGVTIKGAGHRNTILSFKGQEAGSEGLLVTSDATVLEDFAIEDTKGDALKVMGVDTVTMRRMRVEWTGGPKETNGAYGFYPVSSKNVLIEEVIAIGASDAGIYVGQSEDIIVRNSLAAQNVAGIEIENSYRADVTGNTAVHNTGGILVFDLPMLPKQGGHDVRVFGNKVWQNDTPNFAPEGNIVASVPKGTGIMVMANRNVEIFDNEIGENGTANVLVVSYPYDHADKNYDPYPRAVSIRGNRFGRGGFAPDNEIGEMVAEMGGTPVADIVWDGVTPLGEMVLGVPDGEGIYIGENEAVDEGGQVDAVDLNAAVYYLAPALHWVRLGAPDHGGEPQAVAPVVLPQDDAPLAAGRPG